MIYQDVMGVMVAYMIVYVSSDRIHVNRCYFFQAEDGIRDLVRSRGLGDVYKRQDQGGLWLAREQTTREGPSLVIRTPIRFVGPTHAPVSYTHLTLPTIYPV